MPRPDTRVRIAFDLAAGGSGDFFTLDDPVKGELDNAPFGLAGDILEDVTDDVRTVSIRRGRSRELERYQAGAASVSLNSQDRKYDPSYKVTQSATGGDSTYEIDVSGTTYVVHEFTTVGTATFTPGVVPLRGVEYLVVAGGGAGGNQGLTNSSVGGAGGGAGGFVEGSTTVSATESIVVGAGGVGSVPAVSGIANSGDDSSAFGVVALGGGGGSHRAAPAGGGAGGSGGGANFNTGVGGAGDQPASASGGFGNAGGSGATGASQRNGGGGGAGAVGNNGGTAADAGFGGEGRASSITGTSVFYAGGGGSGTSSNAQTLVVEGGSGGGGDGGRTGLLNGEAGEVNTGGGGGGQIARAAATLTAASSDGGSGIVIVRYPKIAFPSPNVASMRPRKAVQIVTAGEQVFNGIVDDWDLQYSLDGDHVASVKVTDAFAFLAQQQIEPHTTTAQATGARINAILDRSEIAFPAAKRSIDDGVATLQADAIGGTANPQPVNALQYLQKVDEAEQGALFIGKDGVLTFKDKGTLQILTNVKFADDGTGIPFTSIDASYGSEELRNRITVTRLNGGTATAAGTASIDAYGAIDFEIRDSLLADDTQAQDLADQILARYAEPLLRIDGIEVVLNALTDEQVADVLSLDLGSLVQVVYTPSGIGDPIDQFTRLDQIEHNIDANQHRVRLSFSQGETPALVLDSDLYGHLDENTLGY